MPAAAYMPQAAREAASFMRAFSFPQRLFKSHLLTLLRKTPDCLPSR